MSEDTPEDRFIYFSKEYIKYTTGRILTTIKPLSEMASMLSIQINFEWDKMGEKGQFSMTQIPQWPIIIKAINLELSPKLKLLEI